MRIVSSLEEKFFPKEIAERFRIVPIGFDEEKEAFALLCDRMFSEEEQKTIMELCRREYDQAVYFFADKRYNFQKIVEEYYDICYERADYREIFRQAMDKLSMEDLLMFCLQSAIELNASDIHLLMESESFRVKLRLDGTLRTLFSVVGAFGEQLIRYIKVKAQIDISRTRTPLEGRFTQCVHQENLDIRVSIMPTVSGEKISLRILGIGRNLFDLEDIGLDEKEQECIKDHIRKAAGFVLVTGPTGSGKTTTLLTILRAINDGTKNIVSIEDPVEYRLDGVAQIGLTLENRLGFDEVLRFTLRQDPDVILIGEIRDAQTADTGLKAAMTGHLVLSSIHTKSTFGAVERLIDLGVDAYMVSEALSLIVNQRLVRLLCPKCKGAYPIESRQAAFLGMKESGVLYRAKGCPFCYGTGYAGRKAVFEMLEVTGSVREKIKGQAMRDLKIKGLSLQEKIKSMVTEGTTSFEEYAKYW